VRDSLISLGPLLRPFIVRSWIEKAANLNGHIDAADAMVHFERFMFRPEREAPSKVREGLLDIQQGRCIYCLGRLGAGNEVDHFVPWSFSGDDGLDNLVIACHPCNNRKRATLAGPEFLEAILERNDLWQADLTALSQERSWPKNEDRTMKITRSAYLHSPAEKPVWMGRAAPEQFASVGQFEAEFQRLLAGP
jgi:hypothetical protein